MNKIIPNNAPRSLDPPDFFPPPPPKAAGGGLGGPGGGGGGGMVLQSLLMELKILKKTLLLLEFWCTDQEIVSILLIDSINIEIVNFRFEILNFQDLFILCIEKKAFYLKLSNFCHYLIINLNYIFPYLLCIILTMIEKIVI